MDICTIMHSEEYAAFEEYVDDRNTSHLNQSTGTNTTGDSQSSAKKKRQDTNADKQRYSDLERAHIYACLVSAWHELDVETGTYTKAVYESTVEQLRKRFNLTKVPTQRYMRDLHKSLLTYGTVNGQARWRSKVE